MEYEHNTYENDNEQLLINIITEFLDSIENNMNLLTEPKIHLEDMLEIIFSYLNNNLLDWYYQNYLVNELQRYQSIIRYVLLKREEQY